MLGWCIDQSIIRYPNVLTASEIVRQLGVAKSTGTMLKRRLQLWGLQHKEVIRKLMYEELQERYGNKRKLPQKDYQNLDLDVTRWLRDKRVPQADTVVLYSTRPNATGNKRRKRHHGQVASIFRADSLGGDQVGTMLQCVTWKAEPGRGAPAIYDSISNQRAETLIPLLDKTIPKNCPFFTDYGYKFYVRHNKNHRMVNHSLPARRGKGKSRRRWSQCSVHTQVVEGRQGALKTAFRQYRYIKPRYSELYLGEYSLWSALKYYGVETIASAGRESRPDRVLSGGVDSGEKNLKLIAYAEDTTPAADGQGGLKIPRGGPVDFQHKTGKKYKAGTETEREFEVFEAAVFNALKFFRVIIGGAQIKKECTREAANHPGNRKAKGHGINNGIAKLKVGYECSAPLKLKKFITANGGKATHLPGKEPRFGPADVTAKGPGGNDVAAPKVNVVACVEALAIINMIAPTDVKTLFLNRAQVGPFYRANDRIEHVVIGCGEIYAGDIGENVWA